MPRTTSAETVSDGENSQIRLVLSDMDDTLASHMQNEVSDAVRRAVIAVEAQGVKFAVVTGRAHQHAVGALNVLGVEGPCVFDGGATIADAKSGDVLWKQWVDIDTTRLIVNALKRYCFEAYFSPTYEMQKLDSVDVEQIDEEAPSIFALATDAKLIASAMDWAQTLPNVKAYNGLGTHPDTGARFPYIQITHDHADKFHGVEALRRMLGIAMPHTMAIGDGDNDEPLFQNAGLRVAMGNATPRLKSLADYVVGTLEEDGVAEALNRFVLR